MKRHLLKTIGLMCLLLVFQSAQAQIGKCKGKYLGNIIAGNVPSTYTANWNQVTSENASKWGSVEGRKGQYTFGGSDICYNWAKNNNGIFKYHALIWGAQAPGWTQTESTASIMAAIDPYFKAVRDHYAPMGGLKMIDVLNEPVNTPMLGNLKAALTAGYKAEPANAGDLNNQYGWAIWCFQVARKYFPDATLLINEYNIEMNWNNCRAPYIAMSQAIKNAPNLTDGKKNLIDGVGLQAHGINNLTAANFKACIDEIWNKTGLPIHITEFDATADPNEAKQQSVYSTLIPVAWEHPHVAGITFWGYIQGQTWIGGNKQTGPGGTDSGIMYANGNDRPAMTWMRQYFAGRPSLSCCPAPGPFASCTPTNPVPVVSITSPGNNTVYTEGENITINATATITAGSISKVEFYAGTTLLGTDATSPYSYTITAATAGNYVITAKATSAANASATSTAVNIQVAKPIYQTGSAPVIDGTIDGLWNNIQSVSIAKNNTGTISSASDLSGNWKAVWDAANLYVLVQVTDDIKRNDGGTDVYNDDGVEIYMDMGNTKASAYGSNDHQYTFRWNDATAAYEINGHSVAGITKSITNTSTGYIVEVSIPWSTMGGSVTANSFQGFEVMLNDDDDGGAREGKLAWIATTDDTWSNPGLMGTIVLKGLNCTTPTAAITTTASTTFCAGGSVILNAGTGTGYSYVWKNGSTAIAGATAQTYTATTAGSYTVTVTNAGGCLATSLPTVVTVNALPSASITTTTPTTFCAGGNVTLNANTGSGLTYQWYNGSNTTGSGTASLSLYVSSGSFTVKVTDGNGCSSTSAPVVVTINALPTATITTTTPTTFCQGGSVVLTASSGASYKWMNGTTTITGATAQSYTATTAGSYTVEVTNTANCKAISSATAVTVNALPSAMITTTMPTTFCQGGSVVLTAGSGASYKWMNGTTTITGATAQSYTATTAGSYTVEVTNTTNCKAISSATAVTVNALPAAAITTTTPVTFCQGGSVVLTAGSGSSYKWMNGTTAITGATAQSYTATTAGSYTVEVTNTTNCKAISSATAVTVNALPAAAITTTTPVTFCQGGSVVLTAGSGSSYKWMNGTTAITGATAQSYTATTAGSYTVEVTNTTNCKAISSATTVTVNALPTAAITANGSTAIPQGGSVELEANAGTGFTYVWYNVTAQVGTSQTYTATTAGSYTVEVTNAANCKAISGSTIVSINTVTTNQPSVITITSPVPDATVTGSIDISVDITDADGTITLVEFLDGNTVIGTSKTAPYVFTWDNPS
jgi:GH35 family endo-1,4-beta-xylanase